MKNEDANDFDLVKLAQLIHRVFNRRKRLILFLFIAVFSVGIYHYLTFREIKNSYYLIKCNTHFFQNDKNDLKNIGLELSYNLSNYVTNKNYENLAKLIGVDQKRIEAIDKIKVVNVDENDNNNYFRLYLYFLGNDSTYQIMSSIIEHMNNQPLLLKQKKLNELYNTNYVNELDQQINKIALDSAKLLDENTELAMLINQKNELIIKKELNEPFYLLNGENNIAIKNNYILDLFKYLFYFLFITFTIVIATEAFIFLKKNKISSN